MYVSGLSVCIFVALWLCGFVCSDGRENELSCRMSVARANKVEGTMS